MLQIIMMLCFFVLACDDVRLNAAVDAAPNPPGADAGHDADSAMDDASGSGRETFPCHRSNDYIAIYNQNGVLTTKRWWVFSNVPVGTLNPVACYPDGGNPWIWKLCEQDKISCSEPQGVFQTCTSTPMAILSNGDVTAYCGYEDETDNDGDGVWTVSSSSVADYVVAEPWR